MEHVFGKPWVAVTLEEVRDLLQHGDSEPLHWEAKAGKEPKPDVVRQQCGAFGNSVDGGCLILGAHEGERGWELPGVAIPGGEPEAWVTSVLQAGVNPRPNFDVKWFAVEAGRVVLIRVDACQDGPCLVNGTVWERLPGSTQRVRDPLRLSELQQRSRAAHSTARSAAHEVAQAGFDQWFEQDPAKIGEVIVCVGVAATGQPANAESSIFRESTRQAMLEGLGTGSTGGVAGPTVQFAIEQRGHMVTVRPGLSVAPQVAVLARVDGSVCGMRRGLNQDLRPESLVQGFVRGALSDACRVVRHLKGGPTGYVTVLVYTKEVPQWKPALMHRGPSGLESGDVDLAYVARELGRTLGADVPEPEAD